MESVGQEVPKIENSQETEEGKKVEFPDLLCDPKEAKRRIKEFAIATQDLSGQEMRQAQTMGYRELLKSVLKMSDEEIKESDPFKAVGGILHEEVYKYPYKNPATSFENIMAAKTAIGFRGDLYYDIFLDNTAGESITIEESFFDPVRLVQSKDWHLEFGFIFVKNFPRKWEFEQGTVRLEREVVDSLSDQGAEELLHRLEEIFTWFNHDGTAHAAFLPYGSEEVSQFVLNYYDKGRDLYSEFRENKSIQDINVLKGELWSGAFHRALFEEMVARRPAIDRFLRMHIKRFVREVDERTEKIEDISLREDVRRYLINAYSFAFFRLVNPERLEEGGDLAELKESHPYINEIGDFEQEVQKYFHELSGMEVREGYNPYTEPKTMHHSEIITHWAKAKELVNTLGNLKQKLLETNEIVTELEPQEVIRVIESMEPAVFARWFYKNLGGAMFGRSRLMTYEHGGRVINTVSQNRNAILKMIVENSASLREVGNFIKEKMGVDPDF